MPQPPARCRSDVKVQGSSLNSVSIERPLVALWEKGDSTWLVSHISNLFPQEKELPALQIRTISPKTNVLDIGDNNDRYFLF